jgi:hypothetical protein
LTNNKSNVKRNGLNIEKSKALEEQIKSNEQDLLYKINDLKNEQMKINKNITNDDNFTQIFKFIKNFIW